MADTSQNPHAAKLEALLHLYLSAAQAGEITDDTHRLADDVASMPDEEIAALASGKPPPARYARGDFLPSLHAAEHRPMAPSLYRGASAAAKWSEARALADLYAGLYTSSAAAGNPPDEDELDQARAEVEPHRWTVEPAPGGYRATSLVEEAGGETEAPSTFSRTGAVLMYAVRRAPKGGVQIGGKWYPGGKFIPGDVMEQASAEEKKNLELLEGESKSSRDGRRNERRRGRGRRAGGGRAGAKADLDLKLPEGKAQNLLDAAYRALRRYHEEETLERVEDLLDFVNGGLARAKQQQAKEAMARQLARVRYLLSLARRDAQAKGEEKKRDEEEKSGPESVS